MRQEARQNEAKSLVSLIALFPQFFILHWTLQSM